MVALLIPRISAALFLLPPTRSRLASRFCVIVMPEAGISAECFVALASNDEQQEWKVSRTGVAVEKLLLAKFAKIERVRMRYKRSSRVR
jgi:hypothetical protein